MKKRSRSSNATQKPDTSKLDIFLDVLMNSVGIFMLIAMLLSLQISAGTKILLEVNRPPKEEKKPYFFEIRGEDVIDLTETRQAVNDKVDEIYVSNAACFLEPPEEYQSCVTDVTREFENFQLQTAYYNVQVDWEEGNFLYEPVESRASSDDGSSELQKVSLETEGQSLQWEEYLNKIDSEQYYLVFITRPNGFPTYQEVRKIAVNENFEVGWEPYPYNQPLIFSASGEGRQVGIQ